MNIQIISHQNAQQLSIEDPISIATLLETYKPPGYKKVFLAKVGSRYVDLQHLITEDCHIQLITSQDDEASMLQRDSFAYLLVKSVLNLHPNAKPIQYQTTDTGFYYDFAETPNFNEDHLNDISNGMQNIVQQKQPIVGRDVSLTDAIAYFGSENPLKSEHLKQYREQSESITTLFQPLDDSVNDIYIFPLVANTSFLPNFKITHVSGAYWQGDASQPMLQRIYVTCWATRKQLTDYLKQQEEAAKRDHRKLSQQLDLLHFDERAPGAVFWHAKGWKIFQLLTGYLRHQQEEAGYIEVNTPDVMDRELWEISGHWQNYKQQMFAVETPDEKTYALKPMSCPGAVCLYGHDLKSYRELPLKMAEFGKVHRYEPSGSLHGLMRVRHFTQDDAHIFCTKDQLLSECVSTIRLIYKIYQHFGFDNISIKVSTRPKNRIGSEQTWDFLEQTLIQSLQDIDIAYEVSEGEGAFYGPKIEFTLKDAIGREWQCGTIQVDLNLPERFDLSYINEDNQKQKPVMLHRAIFGSLERFIGILIEHYAGHLPFWLAPVQVMIITISEHQQIYAQQVLKRLQSLSLRVECDFGKDKLGYKIRKHTLQKIPFLLLIGGKELEESSVRVRTSKGTDLGLLQMDELEKFLRQAMVN
ncbi:MULTISPECIES: threonine--tRNA ligase [Psychrobacter]|jgi:threonyl-tRNA synthetase|nr:MULTISPECIES: threonine--tRNA ligase [Psychrobacter]PAT63211.1 threonine--tRNA ligase [Psychrobacter sp. JB193]HCI76780.1 threonine--tRNA ligase [Psychrobacter sp.]HCT74958.1 threonine--tRNA ligase [Psychrobacter sp.]